MPQPTSDSTAEAQVSSSKPSPNSPAWLNIPCFSVPRAREFYASVFGWSFFSPPGTSSESFHPFKITDSVVMGALMKSDDAEGVRGTEKGKEGGIVVYLMVEDVNATLKRVVEKGGKVKQGKRVEGEHTELGSFWDTEGNVKSDDAEGVRGTEKGKEGGIVVYLMVEDVNATLKRVVEKGGKVKQGKRVEGEHTELGSFWDTEGNVVGILKWLF
ncbi:uncharacterized protein PAC_02568 [Phialocephala subalpina]|uniref:Glyoxalase/fosfomycin resistance/dioxygenase domain-containing protein n=1 Tax=Phialocephala subalpina TaxID=576137 RepID=A0A1L7WIU3_9HELO|nr:uncharacterized protein PAC_02568 [Phialocephala subalpina]